MACEGVDERLHVFLDSQLAPGYIGWVVPGVGLTQVGLASRCRRRPNLDRSSRRCSRLRLRRTRDAWARAAG